jgi:HEAT repeat protein
LRSLRSDDAEVRWAAARAAATVAGGTQALAAALRTETEPQVREALFTSLSRIGTAHSTDELVGFLRSDAAALRTGALDALRALGAEVGQVLPHLLKDTDADIRILSCELARGLPTEEAAAALCSLLAQESEVNVCAAAVDVLAEVGGPAALPVLAQCAARFPQSPFLRFAVQTASNRIHSASARSRD